ncbi:MAG: aldehyde dehydrogenase family protein [Tissierellia bacterium]|nr:aldehyde dehydrogenase family protein [Tissierellia bacterium]
MEKYNLFLDGKWVDSKSNDWITVENPATKQVIAKVPASNEEDVNIAVEGAKKALTGWRKTSMEDRVKYVEKMLEYLEDKTDEITDVIIDELGSVVKITKQVHVNSYFDHIYDFINIAKEMDMVDRYDGYDVYKEPVGVVACLTPWNFPFGQIIKKIMPAFLMGNTVVLKPSQSTPLTAYYFARAAEYANLPAGVLQIVTGRGGEVGNVLATHKDVNMISFTGSTKGGKEVAKLGFDTVKRLALELGGKSPSIILEGADYKEAVKLTLYGVYPNTGQACSSKTRLLAPRKDKEELEGIVIELSKNFKYGDPRDQKNHFGPLINQNALDKVKKYIEIGKEEATLLYEGEYPDLEGYYVPPVAFTDVDNKSRIAQEEIFGPVVSIVYYDSVEEAIELANDTIYGLHALICGPEDKALEVAKEIQSGQIIINDGARTHRAPFGGYKQSGLGREGGIYGLEEYIELKTLFHN